MKVRFLGAWLVLLAPAAASAQLVVDPSGAPLGPNAQPSPNPPPNPYAVPGTVGLGQPTQPAPAPAAAQPARPGQPAAEPAPPPAMYLGEGPSEATSGARYEGETPDVHVVQKGDTLWDICLFYFGNPWKWPEIWGYNPQITNPHWIYPGDLVRLEAGAPLAAAPTAAPTSQPQAPATQGGPPELVGAPRRTPTGVELRQLAFVSTEDLRVAGTVTGSKQEKELLSGGDDLYIDYPAGKPPQVGRKYAVYTPTKEIKHPETGEVLGSFVMVRGEVVIDEVKKDKRALGHVTQVTDIGTIERGERVGTLKTQFHTVEPVAADRSLEGIIVGIIGSDVLIGEWQVVFLDRGAADGLKAGNQLVVVRRGDAYPKQAELSPAGKFDRRYPDNYIASVIVVETSKKTAIGLVLRSDKEILVGDHVLMRKPN